MNLKMTTGDFENRINRIEDNIDELVKSNSKQNETLAKVTTTQEHTLELLSDLKCMIKEQQKKTEDQDDKIHDLEKSQASDHSFFKGSKMAVGVLWTVVTFVIVLASKYIKI
jgi:predicted  nucleic acid-binding Zn-ribbon protein